MFDTDTIFSDYSYTPILEALRYYFNETVDNGSSIVLPSDENYKITPLDITGNEIHGGLNIKIEALNPDTNNWDEIETIFLNEETAPRISNNKSFVINRELKNSNGILIWLDGDVETLSKINIQDFKTILNGKFLACQTEKQQYKYPHIESGILIFDCSHPTTKIFQKKFEEYYYSNKILSMKKPYDGYVIGRVLKENDLDFVNLNKNFEIIGKMSTADTTFQHPFLKERFIHRIGQAKHEA
jgi:hypothetical protein